MSWATHIIARLQNGETVTFRPKGRSMEPRVLDGALCTVEPVLDSKKLAVSDVVLCHVAGNDYLHLIRAVDLVDGTFLIGNMRGRNNGWITPKAIFGKLTKVES